MTDRTPDAAQALTDANLQVRSFPPSSAWGLDAKPGIRNHAKVILIDQKAFYIGSQNFYATAPTSLAEYGFIVEDDAAAQTLYGTYFSELKTWALPVPVPPPRPVVKTYTITITAIGCAGVSFSVGAIDVDEVYIVVNGEQVWPTSGSKEMFTRQTVRTGDLKLPAVRNIDQPILVQIFEDDWLFDDEIGTLSFHPDAPLKLALEAKTKTLAQLLADTEHMVECPSTDATANYTLTFKYSVAVGWALSRLRGGPRLLARPPNAPRRRHRKTRQRVAA